MLSADARNRRLAGTVMARDRVYGSDTDFMAWMRAHHLLPANSADCGFVATDNDIVVHRYKTAVDGLGTREIQSIMDIETKTRNGMPTPSQLDTLYKRDMFRGTKETPQGELVRYYGTYVLRMSGTTPENSDQLWWCHFSRRESNRLLIRVPISKKVLIDLLRFDRHPDNLSTKPLRRHHKTTTVVERQVADLGFEYYRHVKHRS